MDRASNLCLTLSPFTQGRWCGLRSGSGLWHECRTGDGSEPREQFATFFFYGFSFFDLRTEP